MDYNVNIRSGSKGSYYKNYLELTFNYKDKEYSVEDLFNRIFELEGELAATREDLKTAKAVIEQKQEKINGLLLESIKQLTSKVARLEYKINDEE